MLASTSLAAYADIKDKLNEKQGIVYETIKALEPCTNEQIADHLGWAINRVTGRCTELHKFDMITVAGLGKNKSGASAKQWAIKSPVDTLFQGNLFDECFE